MGQALTRYGLESIKVKLSPLGMSDHLTHFALNSIIYDVQHNTHDYKRCISDKAIVILCTLLQSVTWNEIDYTESVNEKYEYFLHIYSDLYNECSPLKKVNRNKCDNSKMWFNVGIKKMGKKKYVLYKILKETFALSENGLQKV